VIYETLFTNLNSFQTFPKATNFSELWNNRKLNPDFALPQPNEFICTNFDIFAENLDPSILPLNPEKIFADDVCECFYKLDGTFKLQHAFICLYFVSPKTVSSVHHMVLTSLYSMIVNSIYQLKVPKQKLSIEYG
jgi:secreted Zn-dependent insulinase-like peptidase